VRNFLHGLFTTHLVTKIVSLLLASVLFVFTQQSISDEQTIEELTIRFELEPDVAKVWVLDNRHVVLKNLKVAGLRKDLAVEVGSLRRADFVINKIITEQFIRDYRVGDAIIVDADLLRAENIPWEFGRAFQIDLQRAGRLPIERLGDVTFRPTLTPEMRELLKLSESSPFRAADGGLQIEPEWVQPNGAEISTISISGPKSLLPDIEADSDEVPPLYINVPVLAELLRGRPLAEARELIKISSIDWKASGIGDITRLYVRAPNAETLKSLEKSTLHFRCDLTLTPNNIQVTLAFTFTVPAKGGLTLERVAKEYSYLGRDKSTLFDYQPQGQPITEWTEVVNLVLEVTETWKGKQAELAKMFFLEIDIANATKATEKRLEVPIRLKPRNVEAQRVLADGEVRLPAPLVIFRSE